MRRVCFRVTHLAMALIALLLASHEAAAQLTINEGTDRGPSGPVVGPRVSCPRPLSETKICKSACPTFDEFVRKVEALGPKDIHESSMGKCGDLRYVLLDWVYDTQTLYFDASGELVALVNFTDHVKNGRCLSFGTKPRCREERERVIYRTKDKPPRDENSESR